MMRVYKYNIIIKETGRVVETILDTEYDENKIFEEFDNYYTEVIIVESALI